MSFALGGCGMIISLSLLIFSLLFILFVCAIFTNAVEWLGKVLNLSHGVTGSILAAVGTALPETIIPIIAIVFTNSMEADNIGIGAIAGAPFMLATLGFFITGFSVIFYSIIKKRNIYITADKRVFQRDLTFFIIVYGIAILTTFFNKYVIVKNIVAEVLIISYLFYVKLTFKNSIKDNNVMELEEFYLSKFFRIKRSLFWIIIELMLALTGIVLGAHLFVNNVENVSDYFGITPLILSILITPIATELPEKLNSVIWMGKKKDTLALGNITGAMVFQSCFPVAFGIMFTPWHLEGLTMISAVLAIASATINLVYLKAKSRISPFILMSGAVFYLLFLLYLILN
jgi:cation:H+ antiporter